MVCQILTVILYQMSAFPNFPFQRALRALTSIMDVAVRFTAKTVSDGHAEQLRLSVNAAILSLDAWKSVQVVQQKLKVHQMVHIPKASGFGSAYELDEGPFENKTTESRQSATSSNWKSPGLDIILDACVLEKIKLMALVSPAKGGFSVEQQRILRRLPSVQAALGISKCSPLTDTIECEEKCSQVIQFGPIRRIGASHLTREVMNLDMVCRPFMRCFFVESTYERLLLEVEEAIKILLDAEERKSSLETAGTCSVFKCLRLNRQSPAKNFAQLGHFIRFVSSDNARTLGCLRLVIKVDKSVVIVLQSTSVGDAPVTVGGVSAVRVRLNDGFHIITDPKVQETFRVANVEHDCKRSSAILRRVACDMTRDGSFKHNNDRWFFINPAWHGSNYR